jgi:hypothetical protein
MDDTSLPSDQMINCNDHLMFFVQKLLQFESNRHFRENSVTIVTVTVEKSKIVNRQF